MELRSEPFFDNQANERFGARVEALQRPASYPGDVREVEAIETHMAWVFLTESHAYKLKKPIRTPHLDHTSLEARHRACQTELELNERLAASVYLDVVALVENDEGMRVEAEGRAVDWLVKMRRLPRQLMLDHCIQAGDVTPDAINRLVTKLARFYATAEPAPLEPSAYRRHIAEDIESKAASLEQPHYGLRSTEIQPAVAALQRWLADHGHLLEERADRVVDAHGDLRPEHVCLEREPVVIDCLEFDRSLRLLDPVSELCFLGLECRRLGAPLIAERLLTDYALHSGDWTSTRLASFYASYHAVIRAAVAMWHLDDDAVEEADKWRRRARWYLNIPRRVQ